MAPQQRQNFIPRNEGFVCEYCKSSITPAKGTFRNHCPQCLTSKHVDNIPGDRASSCGGLMPTVQVEGINPDKLDLLQRCQTCKHAHRNKVAGDDNREAIFLIIQRGAY